MPTTAREGKDNAGKPILHLAFELGANQWKLGFTTGPGRAPRERTIGAGDLRGLAEEIRRARSGSDWEWTPVW